MGGPNYLLGLIHGFYPVGKNDPDGVSGGNEDLNTGISVVVLADRILDLINHPDRVKERAEVEKQLKDQAMPIPASSASGEPTPVADLMGKLLQVPKEEADEIHSGHQP